MKILNEDSKSLSIYCCNLPHFRSSKWGRQEGVGHGGDRREVESLPLAAHLHHHCVRCSAGEAARPYRSFARDFVRCFVIADAYDRAEARSMR